MRSRRCAATSSTYCTQWCHEVLCAEIFAPSVFLSGTSTRLARNQTRGILRPIPAQQPTTIPENITIKRPPDILRLCNTNFPNTAQRPSSFSCYSSKWGSHCPHLRTERLSGGRSLLIRKRNRGKNNGKWRGTEAEGKGLRDIATIAALSN